jgi:hypothetical protein
LFKELFSQFRREIGAQLAKAQISAQIEDALTNKQLVRLKRRFEDGWVSGYIVDIGPRFFLLSLVSDRIWFDGFECFRKKDVLLCENDPYASFAEAALRKRGQRKPKKPRINLDNLEELLLSANGAFPLVTIHHEEVDPDVCYIGRVLGVNRGRVSLLEIAPGAIWDKTPTEHRLNEITRVSFGGDYENALYLVGGEPPSE